MTDYNNTEDPKNETNKSNTHASPIEIISDVRDVPGSNNPSATNRHAGTCVPPVNMADHVKKTISRENEDGDFQAKSCPDTKSSSTKEDKTDALMSEKQDSNSTQSNPYTHHMYSTEQGLNKLNEQHPDHSRPQKRVTEENETTEDSNPNKSTFDNEQNVVNKPHTTSHKDPSTADKIKGKYEEMSGKITGDKERTIKGEQIFQGHV